MNAKEHKKYLKELKELTKEILSSEEATSEFLIEAGINTPTGRLTKNYSDDTQPIGFKIPKKK